MTSHSRLPNTRCWWNGWVVKIKDSTPLKWRLAALLHDAPEYVIGDLISPFKSAVGKDYKAVEDCLQAAIHIRFGLPTILPEQVVRLIKRADKTAAYLEATQLAGFCKTRARKIFGRSAAGRGIVLQPCRPDEVKQRFLDRFSQLYG